MKSPLNRDAVPFSPRALYPQNTTLPPVSPVPTPSLTSNASNVSASECRTPPKTVLNMHIDTGSPQSSPRRRDIFSATYPDPLLTGPATASRKNKKVRTRVIFTPDEHAIPFVPTMVRQRALVAKDRCIEEQEGEQVDLKQWLPSTDWIPSFRCITSGGVIRTNELRKDMLIPLVKKNDWDFASLSQLAGMFISRVVQSSTEPELRDYSNALAHFAILMYDEFCLQVSTSCASYFIGSLRSCLLSEFRAWWLARNPCSVVKLTVNSPSPPHSEPLQNLAAALTVGKFIGDFFSWGGCSASLVKICLDIVAHNLSCVEELECIMTILEHCDESLYKQVRMHEFLMRVRASVAKMDDNSASCYSPPVKDKIDGHLQSITNFIESRASTETEPEMSSPLESFLELFRPDAEEDYQMGLPPRNRPTPLRPSESMPPLPPVPQPTQAMTFRAPAAQTLPHWPALPPPDVRYTNPILVAQAAYLRRVANGSQAPPPPALTGFPTLECPPRFQQLPPRLQKNTPRAQVQHLPGKREVLAQFRPGDNGSEETREFQRETALSQPWNEHVREWSH
ncbi:hypothetical protein QCA50_006548 [Cerrena zonata]|uniref:Uncharacterized protein n=1 Tax=Cerrena zonata TaxID=2478898 RepID=A0AAW0GDV5_9APHY